MNLIDMMVNERDQRKRMHNTRPHARKVQTQETPTYGARSKAVLPVGREKRAPIKRGGHPAVLAWS